MHTDHETHLYFGVFRDTARAKRAIETLIQRGVPADAITAVHPGSTGDLNPNPEVDESVPISETGPKAVARGGAIGAVLGGTAAIVGVALTGGLGAVVIGPLIGAGATGTVVGGLIGALVNRGIKPDVADLYDQALRRGRILVAVETDDASKLALADQVFQEIGVEPITAN